MDRIDHLLKFPVCPDWTRLSEGVPDTADSIGVVTSCVAALSTGLPFRVAITRLEMIRTSLDVLVVLLGSLDIPPDCEGEALKLSRYYTEVISVQGLLRADRARSMVSTLFHDGVHALMGDDDDRDLDDLPPDSVQSGERTPGLLEPARVLPPDETIREWVLRVAPQSGQENFWVGSEPTSVSNQAMVLSVSQRALLSTAIYLYHNTSQDTSALLANLDLLGGNQDTVLVATWVLYCGTHPVDVRPHPAFGRAPPYGFLKEASRLSGGVVAVDARVEDEVREIISTSGFSPRVEQFLISLFFPARVEPKDVRGSVHPLVIEYLASALAEARSAGVDETIADEAVARSAVAWQVSLEKELNLGSVSASALVEGYNLARQSLTPVFTSAQEWVLWVQDWLVTHSWPVEVFEWITSLALRAGEELRNLGVTIMTLLVSTLEEMGISSRETLAAGGALICGLADLLDPHHRTNPKSVWALIFRASGAYISAGDAMLFTLPEMQYEDPSDYQEWATRIKALCAAVDESGSSRIPFTAPARTTFLPRDTYGLRSLEQHMTQLEGRVIETERERSRIEKLVRSGAVQGIDGAWMATPERTAASLNRYLTPVAALSAADKTQITAAADALYNRFPAMYANVRPMTVGAVMSAMQWKYSAGSPFMSVVRKRKSLLSAPWFQMIKGAAEQILSTGRHPGTVFGGFPKADVVKLDKALQEFGMRTITSHDVITMIVGNVISMERNKRPPPIDAWVMNKQRRTEGGLLPFREFLMQRDIIVQGDGERFDSTVPADVAITSSRRLIERGYEGRWNGKAAASIAEAVYSAICYGLIVNYTDGSVIKKAGGGGTGSFNTSGDNVDWVRVMFVAAYSIVSGSEPSSFFDHYNLGDAADDIALSFNADHHEEFRRIVAYIRSAWGVSFNFETMSPDTMGYLHVKAIPVPEESLEMYRQLGKPVPPVALIHDPARLALKRSAYRSDRASASLDKTLDYTVSRGIGHMQLTAHQPQVYHDLATEVMEDVTDKLKQWYEHVEWTVDVDEAGLITNAHVDSFSSLTPRMIRRYARRGVSLDDAEPLIRRMINRWLKGNRIPSYKKIFHDWVSAPSDAPDATGITRRFRKVDILADASTPLTDYAKFMLIRARRALRGLGGSLVKSQIEFPGFSPVRRFTFSSYKLESFVWVHMYLSLGRPPTPDEFSNNMRVSPFSSAVDPVGFLWRVNTPGSPEMARLMRLAVHGRDHIAAAIINYTLVYVMVDRLIGWAAKTPILGVFVQFFLLLSEMSSLYAVLGYIHYMGSGQASVEISNLMPKDPFAFQKQLSSGLAGMVPWGWTPYPGAFWILSRIPACTSYIAKYAQSRHIAGNLVHKALTSVSSEWVDVAGRVVEGHRSGELSRTIRAVTAGTGSGKSTALIAALVATGYFTEIWLLCPTRLARDQYTNPWLSADQVQIIDRARSRSVGPTVLVCTYGHWLAAHQNKSPGTRRLIILDEYHLESTEIIAVHSKAPLIDQLCLSATPRHGFLQGHPGTTAVVNTRKRHNVTSNTFDGTDLVSGWEHAEACGADMSRALLIHPSETTCINVAGLLGSRGIKATVLSRAHAVPPMSGALVATSIVDVAVTINPPPTVVIDSGLVLLHKPSPDQGLDLMTEVNLVPSSPSVARQRAGRTGRLADGAVFVSSIGGTGPEPEPQLSPLIVLSSPTSAPAFLELGRVASLIKVDQRHSETLEWLRFTPLQFHARQSPELVYWGRVYVALMASNLTFQAVSAQVDYYLAHPFSDEGVEPVIKMAVRGFGILPPRPSTALIHSFLQNRPFQVSTPFGLCHTGCIAYRHVDLPLGRVRVISPVELTLSQNRLIDHLLSLFG